MENITFFLTAAMNMESSMFDTTHLHEEKNIDSVIQCLYTLRGAVPGKVDIPVPQVVERVSERIVEQIVGVTVSQNLEETVAVVKLATQERVQQRIVEQVGDVPVVMQRQVLVIQRVQKTVEGVGVSVALQRQLPTIQTVQKTVEVLQSQYLDRVVEVAMQCQSSMIRTAEIPQVPFLGRILDVPVVMQGQVPTFQKVQKTVKVAHLQYIDRIVDVPVVCNTKRPPFRRFRRPSKGHRCSSLTRLPMSP